MRKCDRAEKRGVKPFAWNTNHRRGGVSHFVRGRPSVFKKWDRIFFLLAARSWERDGQVTKRIKRACTAYLPEHREIGEPAASRMVARVGVDRSCVRDPPSIDHCWSEIGLPWSERGSREQRCAVCMEENGRGSGEEMRWPKP